MGTRHRLRARESDGTDDVDGPAGFLMIRLGPKSPVASALLRGVFGQCPQCGKSRLLHRYLKIIDHCPACGESYGHFRTDDAASWLTILVVGHLTVPVIFMLEQNFHPVLWLAFAIYLPLIALLTLALLPRCKGLILAVMWTTKAEGSERLD